MSTHLTTQSAEQYRQRLLPAADLLALDDHLTVCEECRQRLLAAVALETVVSDFQQRLQSEASALELNHLSYEQLAALVDNEADQTERNAFRRHIEVCASCADDLSDLTALRSELPDSTEAESANRKTPSLKEKIRALLPANRWPLSPVLTGALAVLFITAAVAVFFAWRSSRTTESTVQTTLPKVNASPESNTGPTPSPQQQPGANEQVVMTLNDASGPITVDANGNVLGLGPLRAAANETVQRALKAGKVEVPDSSDLIGVKGRLLGAPNDDGSFSLISPVGSVTRARKPTLRWKPLTGATSYKVSILDGSYNVITASEPITTTSWTSTVSLDRGRVYSWQVTALKDGKEQLSPKAPEPEARFKVLDRTTVDELINVEKASKSHLVRGTIYARAGLLDDAERELSALLTANPNSRIARDLLQSVRAKTRR